MKIVIDTNVLISAAFRGRVPETIILWLLAHPEWEWIASHEIIQEYKEVLIRPKFNLTTAQIEYWQKLIDESVQIVPVSIDVDFPRDRKDAKFLACAIANHKEFPLLKGGDKGVVFNHHFPLKTNKYKMKNNPFFTTTP